MHAAAWEEALGAYWDEHETLDDGPAARSPVAADHRSLVAADCGPCARSSTIPKGNHDWAIVATVDLDASDAAGEPVIRTQSFGVG